MWNNEPGKSKVYFFTDDPKTEGETMIVLLL